MKSIELSKGYVALVDDEDFEYLNVFSWYTQTFPHTEIMYASRTQTKPIRKCIKMHRLILNPLENEMVDHIDGNGLNNQKSNLRLVNNQRNLQNSKPYKNKKYSNYKGVGYDLKRKKFRANIRVNKVLIYLGRFETELEAAEAYNKAALKYFGEYSRINDL